MKGTLYLIHFDRPISEGHTSQHYLGFAEELMPRFYAHLHGRGARLTQVAVERGIGFELVRAWQGNRSDERRLKNQKNAPRLCPHCSERPQHVGRLTEIEL